MGSFNVHAGHYVRCTWALLSMHEQITFREDGFLFMHRLDEDQGFVDQFGVYMDRKEAYQVAKAAGQLHYPERCGSSLDGPKLYSEGLY